jgi:DNA-binding NarL/FixJ family response regulator
VSKVQLFKLVSDGKVEPKFSDEELSTRELAVLELICNEKKNNEIADKLCISVRTVEVHRQNLLRKTNAKNVAGLVVYAIKKGYFEI